MSILVSYRCLWFEVSLVITRLVACRGSVLRHWLFCVCFCAFHRLFILWQLVLWPREEIVDKSELFENGNGELCCVVNSFFQYYVVILFYHIMHSLFVTGRLISRALFNGIHNFSTATDPKLQQKTEPHLVSAVCGFSKEKRIQRLVKGQFGDDAWFSAKYKSTDVLGKLLHNLAFICVGLQIRSL